MNWKSCFGRVSWQSIVGTYESLSFVVEYCGQVSWESIEYEIYTKRSDMSVLCEYRENGFGGRT